MPESQGIVYIGLGSNLETPVDQINLARSAINHLQNVRESAFSSLYRSAPMGPIDQPDYINAVMAIYTSLGPLDLLRKLQQIESQHGRVRKDQRWGARTLDLDILLYGNQQIDCQDLKLPHYGMAERAFVLYPLYEIAPELDIPGVGKLADLLTKVPPDGLEKLNL
jgi:2-amino-4-hydroxy-6-hydroxymethyldihydropteridine diphosphokinase